ncbi:MAG: NADH-quinone oxidoreductase subunit C [Solirubrobacterales bacterium]
MDTAGLELIANELRDRFAGSIVDTSYHREVATLVVDPAQVTGVLGWLKDEPEQRYDFLASLHGSDYLPATPRFGVHYELLNMERVERMHVKAVLEDPGAPELPEIDSCVELFPTANFQEREAYDMFGVRFRGHPDLRRILMPDDYGGFPQRRDFPIGGEPVLFTHSEHQVPRWYE